MLPNTQKLTSQMAMMPDAALKQMAMMHKNDPYTLPLIIAEDSRRKEMRQAAQARMAAPQPNVADQQIAQMGAAPQMPMPQGAPQGAPQQLPEHQGIGALPAQNLERMADGGIAGYADGGAYGDGMPPQGMFNYAHMAPAVDLHPDSGVTPRSMASGGIASFGVGGNVTSTDGGKTWSIDVPYSTPRNPVPPALKALAGQTFSSAKEAEAALAAASGETYVPSKLFTSAAATPTVTNPNVKSTGHDFDAVSTTQTTPPKPQPNLSNSGLGSLVPQTPLPAAISPEKATQMAGKFVDDSDLRAQLADAQQQQLVSNAYLKDRAEALKPKGVAYSELEQQLKKEEADTGGQKNEATGMALLKAGLSIAAGGSPFALQNIGQGALAGVADYQDAMKDMKKMARERMKMSADIEQARRAESRDDYKTQMAFEEKAQDRADKLTEKGIDVTAKIFGVKTDVAKDIWATTFKETEATKRSNTAANASANAQLNLFTALGNAPEGSALRKGFDLQTLKQHAASLQEQWSRQAYPNGNMDQPNTGFLRRYPTPQTYIQENMESMNMAGAGGTGGGFVPNLPQGATVLQAPKK